LEYWLAKENKDMLADNRQDRIIFFFTKDDWENTSNLGRKRDLKVLGGIAAYKKPVVGLFAGIRLSEGKKDVK
jgi:hypothetical protein